MVGAFRRGNDGAGFFCSESNLSSAPRNNCDVVTAPLHVLDDGTTLTTLREAVEYLAKTVPKAEHHHPSVLAASDHITRSAEQDYPMFFARAATLQAIHRHRERVFNPDRKDQNGENAN